MGRQVSRLGDDLFVTNVSRLTQGIDKGIANSILVKVNQIGTLTETIQAVQMAYRNGYTAVMSHRSGETEDTTIVDLAIGWQVGQLKVGSFARSERMAKWNEVLRIEEVAGAAGRFAGAGVFGRRPTGLNP